MIKNYLRGYPLPFVGRTRELADITARLQNPDCQLLTLTGLGGSGKTRLAVEAASALVTRFMHGTVFVDLQPLPRSDLLISAIAQAVGLNFYGEGETQTQLLDYLREKTMLLVLDNFEHLLDGAALINGILRVAPGVKILITSREALNLMEEWLYPLKGMAIPPSVYVYSSSMEEYEAVQLFLYHARRIQPDFDLVSDHESVIQICIMTAGLPLAIELAASWLKGLSSTQIAREMQFNLDFLSTTIRNIEERHRSMRAVFDQSWKLLSDSEQLSFARLSVFPGSFDIHAAEQIAEVAFACMATLVEKSLVQMVDSDRFSIHGLLRQYGMEKLEAYGETEPTHTRHTQYFAGLMLQYETSLQQPQQVTARQSIERDFENIRLAWEWAVKHQQTTQLNEMLNGLYLFGFTGSRHREILTLFLQTLEQPITDPPLLGRLLARRWGYLQWWYQVDFQEALVDIEQALTIAAAENNLFEIAFSHLMAAYITINTQQYKETLTHLETSKMLFEAINEPYYVSWVLHRLGFVHYNLKNNDLASKYTEQSLALARITFNRGAEVICLHNLGTVYTLNGDYLKGRYYCTETLKIANESGHRDQIAYALGLMALVAFVEGDYATARDYAERSEVAVEDNALPGVQPYSLPLMIVLACIQEDYAEGMRLAKSWNIPNANLCDLQCQYWSLSILACGLGNRKDAGLYARQAFEFANLDYALNLWIIPGVIYALTETHPEKAVELFAWVMTCPDTALIWVRQWGLFKRLQLQLQAALDHAVYQSHWQNGTTLSFEAVKLYLQVEFRAQADVETEAEIEAEADTCQQLLTARENEIIRLMAAGMTNPQIAEHLVIGSGTVKTHTLNIYRKLEVANRTQAIIRAQEIGLLTLTLTISS